MHVYVCLCAAVADCSARGPWRSLGKIMGEDIRVVSGGTFKSRAVYAKRLDISAEVRPTHPPAVLPVPSTIPWLRRTDLCPSLRLLPWLQWRRCLSLDRPLAVCGDGARGVPTRG